MADAVIRFEREGLEGVVAVGTYLSDAMNRFGIKFDEPCDLQNGTHHCSVVAASGSQLLSELTDHEKEHFSAFGRRKNERLACRTKISEPGEILIMTDQKKKASTTATETEEKPKMVAEFETLPLEQKIANLVRMEAVTLGETISYVFNSPFSVLEKVGDVMAEFGMKLEREAKNAARPPENGAEKKEASPKSPPAAKKPSGRAPRSPKA